MKNITRQNRWNDPAVLFVYEGNGLLVSWCLGHLVSPMDTGHYDDRFRKWQWIF